MKIFDYHSKIFKMNNTDKITLFLLLILCILSMKICMNYREVPVKSEIIDRFHKYSNSSNTDRITSIPHNGDKVVYLYDQSYKFENFSFNVSYCFNFINELKENDPDFEQTRGYYYSLNAAVDRSEFRDYNAIFESDIFIPKSSEIFFGDDLIIIDPGFYKFRLTHGNFYIFKK
jgi:hypothetical protein